MDDGFKDVGGSFVCLLCGMELIDTTDMACRYCRLWTSSLGAMLCAS